MKQTLMSARHLRAETAGHVTMKSIDTRVTAAPPSWVINVRSKNVMYACIFFKKKKNSTCISIAAT